MKIKFTTFGCSLNQADSEAMAGVLESEGYSIVESGEDILVINTCTVKNLAETKFWRALKAAQDRGKKIIVAGCIPEAEQSLLEKELSDVSVIGPGHLDKIAYVVKETLEGNVLHLIGHHSKARLTIPKVRRNEMIDIIPICEGCLGACTYCKTKQARGNLSSYLPDDILASARTAVSLGCKELWLTSQDCGAYGKDINKSLPSLLKMILSIEGDFKVRIGMMNPNHVKDMIDELIGIFKHPKMFRFIHIPVQAGSNRVLGMMNRFYTREEFISIIKRLRGGVPDISVATDIICGFPGETADDFKQSLDLIEMIRPQVLNRSRFWPRPGTKAAQLKGVPSKEIKRRSLEMKDLFEKLGLEDDSPLIGKNFKIIIDEKGKGDTWMGRTDNYRAVVVKGSFLLGDVVKIKITDTKDHFFFGCLFVDE